MEQVPFFSDIWFLLLSGLVTGVVFGSFITMLTYRLPRNLDITLPPSHCPKCNTLLKSNDLIPVISWLLVRGKCRYCRAEIGKRYLWIELATGGLMALVFAMIGFQPFLLGGIAVVVAGVTAVTMKMEQGKK